MERLADLFLTSLRALSHDDAPKQDALAVIREVLTARMPVPRSLLLQVLSALALLLKKHSQLHDEVMNTLQTAVDCASALSECVLLEAHQVQPWLAIALESLLGICRCSCVDQRKKAWKLVADLAALITEPAAAASCFPGLFRAALTEVRSNSNQLIGASSEALGHVAVLVKTLVLAVLADSVDASVSQSARDKSGEAVGSLLESLEVCMRIPANAQSEQTVRRVTNFLKTVVEKCEQLCIRCKRKVCPLLMLLTSISSSQLLPLKFPVVLANEVAITAQMYFQEFVSRAEVDKDNLSRTLAAWELLQDDKSYFATSNSPLVIDLLKKMCCLQLPKVAVYPLDEDALDLFSGFPGLYRTQKHELIRDLAALSVVNLDLMESLQGAISAYSKRAEASTFREVHELAFVLFHFKQTSAFPLLLDFTAVSPPESVSASDQQLYRVLLQVGLLSLLPEIDCSALEFFLHTLRLWSEATAGIVARQVEALARKERADVSELLKHYSEKILPHITASIANSDFAASSEALRCYLTTFGTKHLRELVKCLLVALDRRVNSVKANAAARVVRGLQQVMKSYAAAVQSGDVADGNLAREVLLRVKPLLAWKREKGKHLVAFEVLKLAISLAPALDSVPLTVENSSDAVFAIHEELNVGIPKALPALMHELFPSLVALCLTLTASQDFVCLSQVWQLLIETTKRNPGFMDRRLKEVAGALKDTFKGGPATTTFKLACQTLAIEMLALVRTEVVAACELSAFLGQ